ncbi:hypothetical protein ACFX2K_007471 [Malus domestica]
MSFGETTVHKKIVKTRGLGACKLTTQTNENLYDQEPEIQVSQCQYLSQPTVLQQLDHHLHLNLNFGIDSDFPKRTNLNTSKSSDSGARKKFTSAKSISSSPFDQSRSANVDAKKFIEEVLGFCKPPPAQHDISFLTNISGEIGNKLSSLASNLMKDLQDRVM